MLHPTFYIKHKLWEPQYRRIVFAATVATSLLVFSPTKTKVPYVTQDDEGKSLCLVSLALLDLVSSLLNPPFMLLISA